MRSFLADERAASAFDMMLLLAVLAGVGYGILNLRHILPDLSGAVTAMFGLIGLM